jgi:hypothetical protein
MAEITSDILVACEDENRRGGLKRLFVINRENVTSFTAGSTHDYTAVTLDATSDVFFEIQFDDEGASYTAEGSRENGSSLQEHTIEAVIPRIHKTKAKELQALFTSCKVIVIAETYISTGTYNQAFVIGYDEILTDDAALRANVTTTVEAELQGQNAYTLTMSGKSAEIAREFVGSITSNASGTVNFGS